MHIAVHYYEIALDLYHINIDILSKYRVKIFLC